MVFMRDVLTKSVSSMPQIPLQPPTNVLYYSPNQYGNRQYPPSPGANRTNVRGCYWDGKPHGRDNCDELLKAINRGEVHRKGKVLYLGQEGDGDSVHVPVPVEIEGKITWQQDWVKQQLWEKESEIARVNCVTVEEDETIDRVCRFVEEEINGIPVVFIATKEADVQEKRGRSMNDEGDKEKKRPKVRDFPPVSRKTPCNKEQERAVTLPPNKPCQNKLWATLREFVNLDELSKRTLDAPVPEVTVRELLSISPDLIKQ